MRSPRPRGTGAEPGHAGVQPLPGAARRAPHLASPARSPYAPGPSAPRPSAPSERSGQSWRNLAAAAGRAGSWIGVPLAPPDRPCPSHNYSSLGPAPSPAPLPPRRSLVGPHPTLAQSCCSLRSTRRGPCPSPNLLGRGSLSPVGAGVTIPALSARSPTLRASPLGTPGRSSFTRGRGRILRSGSQSPGVGVGAGAFAQKLVDVLHPSPTSDPFSLSSLGGGVLSLLAPTCL